MFKEMTNQQITDFLRSTRSQAQDTPASKLSIMRKGALNELDCRAMRQHNLNNRRD